MSNPSSHNVIPPRASRLSLNRNTKWPSLGFLARSTTAASMAFWPFRLPGTRTAPLESRDPGSRQRRAPLLHVRIQRLTL